MAINGLRGDVLWCSIIPVQHPFEFPSRYGNEVARTCHRYPPGIWHSMNRTASASQPHANKLSRILCKSRGKEFCLYFTLFYMAMGYLGFGNKLNAVFGSKSFGKWWIQYDFDWFNKIQKSGIRDVGTQLGKCSSAPWHNGGPNNSPP